MASYIVVGCLILFDIITGIAKALYKGGINSSLLRVGLFHKLSEVLAVIGAALFEYGSPFLNVQIGFPLVDAVTLYISVMEITSILENLGEINPTLGKMFRPYLEKLKGKSNKEDDKKE